MHEEILMLALVLAAALLGGRVASRVGYPPILGEIAAGILFGPPLIGLLSRNEAIDVLGEFGILLMMLYIGVHLDFGDLRRASVPGFLAATGGFLIPTGTGMVLMLAVGRTFLEALFVGLAMGVTSLATKSRILVDLKILDTRIAHVLVAAALLSDVAVLVVFAAVIGPGAGEGVSLATAATAGIQAGAFGVAAWIISKWAIPLVMKLVGDREVDRGALFLGVVVFGLAFAWGAELAGLHAILGSFIAGLFIDRRVIGPKTSKDIQDRLFTMSIGVLAPFFFVSAGFDVSLSVFRTDLLLLVAVVVLATLGKIVGTALFYLPSGNGWREGVVVGSGMNGRGAVEIIVAEIALSQGLIDTDVFSILVFMALFTTATVPVLLTMGVRWLRGRGELVKAGDRDKVLIVGAGVLARHLGGLLNEKVPVKMIDTNRAHLRAAEREGLDTYAGDGLDDVAMESAGIEDAALVIAATPNAEVNVLVAHVAADYGVPNVPVMLRESDTKTFGNRLSDVESSIIPVPEDIPDWEHAISTGEAVTESIEVGPNADSRWTGDESETLPLVVIRNDERFPYTNEVILGEGDSVIYMRRRGAPKPDLAIEEPTVTAET